MKTKVLVVDDSAVIRSILRTLINADPDLEVVATARNGFVALKMIEEFDPDIVSLDIEMPVMDGIETITKIRETNKNLPVIMFSTLSTRGAEITMEALSRGANDFVTKPANVDSIQDGLGQVQDELLSRLKEFTKKPSHGSSVSAGSESTPQRKASGSGVQVVVVGSSTGGPVALEKMLTAIKTPLSVPMLIVQHMPPKFTLSLAQRLDRMCASTVKEAEEGDVIKPGHVYIAPGGKHMVVRDWPGPETLKLHEGPPVNSCRPAVDVMFESAVSHYGDKQLGVILTGMGYDGREGSRLIAEAGGDVFAQDEATSVVWGMAGSVVEAGLACKVLPIEDIGTTVSLRVGSMARVGVTS